MKRGLLSSIFIVAFLIACENKGTSKAKTNDTSDASPGKTADVAEDIPTVAGCYMRVMGRDTLVVRLNQSGQAINGNIYFDNYQKDGSSGTATGNINKDTIHLHYSFQSEGTHSVMEMYFQVKDNELIRGIGDMGVKGDTAYFTSVASLTFPGKEKVSKIPCSVLPIKFND